MIYLCLAGFVFQLLTYCVGLFSIFLFQCEAPNDLLQGIREYTVFRMALTILGVLGLLLPRAIPQPLSFLAHM